jgi:hypothetical protein
MRYFVANLILRSSRLCSSAVGAAYL